MSEDQNLNTNEQAEMKEEDKTKQAKEQTQNSNDDSVDELSLLKQRARMMGVEFSNNIGIETLKERIQAKMSGDKDQGNTTQSGGGTNVPSMEDPEVSTPAPKKKRKTLRQKLAEENLKLVRLRITNLDPKKKDLPGEIITVANEYMGTVRKFVPFGEVTENGYHVPYCIYKNLKSRKFLNIRTFKDRRNNNQIKVEQSWAQEFALEVLPPLTKEELEKLASAQTAAGSLN
jgi:anti-sigma28 factor (negative regulator of flagellin synthesis)